MKRLFRFENKKIEKQEARVCLRVYKYPLVHFAARVGDKNAKVGQSFVLQPEVIVPIRLTHRERH